MWSSGQVPFLSIRLPGPYELTKEQVRQLLPSTPPSSVLPPRRLVDGKVGCRGPLSCGPGGGVAGESLTQDRSGTGDKGSVRGLSGDSTAALHPDSETGDRVREAGREGRAGH